MLNACRFVKYLYLPILYWRLKNLLINVWRYHNFISVSITILSPNTQLYFTFIFKIQSDWHRFWVRSRCPTLLSVIERIACKSITESCITQSLFKIGYFPNKLSCTWQSRLKFSFVLSFWCIFCGLGTHLSILIENHLTKNINITGCIVFNHLKSAWVTTLNNLLWSNVTTLQETINLSLSS